MPYGVSYNTLLRDIKDEVRNDEIGNSAAALAFYLTLAIFPAMIFLLSIIPYLPIPNVDQAIMDGLRQALPGEAANMFTGVVGEVTRNRSGGLFSFGILATIWAASAGIIAIIKQLNTIHEVKENRGFFKLRGTAILLSLAVGVLTITSFALVVLGGMLQQQLAGILGWSPVLTGAFTVLRWLIIVAGLLLVFSLMYRYAPALKFPFRFITPGGAIATTLLIAGSIIFRVYVSRFGNYSATYGSIGAVILLMLWMNLAGLATIIGAEVNAVVDKYAERKGQAHREGDQVKPGAA